MQGSGFDLILCCSVQPRPKQCDGWSTLESTLLLHCCQGSCTSYGGHLPRTVKQERRPRVLAGRLWVPAEARGSLS